MRRLPRRKRVNQDLIEGAVNDYFGEGCLPKQRRLKKDIILWFMGFRKGIKLNEEQKEALWFVKSNLADSTYHQNLLISLKK